ncbi:MAG: CopD family protein [Flavobacteriaceae bacterium]
MEAYYNYIKALHLIFVITWFAGLFYMPRLFIYHIEAQSKASTEKEILSRQFKLMAKRLWHIITWPSAILATFFALLLLYIIPSWLEQDWMLIKLVFVLLLLGYHMKTHQMFKAFQRDEIRYTSLFMRLWNEGATLLLFAIVFLVILKSSTHWLFGVLSLVGLSLLLLLGIRFYQRIRKQ